MSRIPTDPLIPSANCCVDRADMKNVRVERSKTVVTDYWLREHASQAGGRRFDPGHVHHIVQLFKRRRRVNKLMRPHGCPHGRFDNEAEF